MTNKPWRAPTYPFSTAAQNAAILTLAELLWRTDPHLRNAKNGNFAAASEASRARYIKQAVEIEREFL